LEKINLKANPRKSVGNGPARRLRRSDQIPAVLYGPKTESVLLAVDIQDLEQILKKSSLSQVILNLVIQNGKKVSKSVMIKELQIHPVSGNFIHVDFYEIDMQRKINVMIPVVTVGKSKGVELGGLLQIVRREIEVFCMPGDIPEAIEIDITDLDIGDSIHIQDIPLGDNVELSADVNFTVVTVLSPKVEEEVVEEEEEELEGAEEAAEETAAEAEAEPSE
jgi:large subunit ribosomal protein L25